MIRCPMDDWTCPYYKSSVCLMEEMGDGIPEEECDAFYGVELNDERLEVGFDPFMGCYSNDC